MTEPWIELEHGLDADMTFMSVPDVLFDYLYARPSGVQTYYDGDFNVVVRTFETH